MSKFSQGKQRQFDLENSGFQTEFYKICQQAEVKIYDTFFKNQVKVEGMSQGLFVRINNKFVPWIETLVTTLQDFDPKYYQITKPQATIQCPRETTYKLINMDSFVTQIASFFTSQLKDIQSQLDPRKSEMGSFSNAFNLMSKPNDDCFVTLVNGSQSHFMAQFDQFIKQNAFETIYAKLLNQGPPQQRCLKVRCPQIVKAQNYVGYCEFCREANHPMVLCIGSQSIELNNSQNMKILDIARVKKLIFNEYSNNINKLILMRYLSIDLDMKDQISTMREQQESLRKQNEIYQEELNKLHEDIRNFEKMRQEYEQIESKKENEDMNSQLAKVILAPVELQGTFYDVVIQCDSILQLTNGKGWEIKSEKSFSEISKPSTIVVSFYGLYNKGKTFMASKLSGKQLPLGYSISTVGLSALYPKDLNRENAVVFLDTAGTETPICYLNEDEATKEYLADHQIDETKPNERKRHIYQLKLQDRLLTEHLLQRFILSSSNIVLIVVDQLTKEEQRLIEKIKNLYQQNELIIIHNFSKLVEIKDVEKFIANDIKDSYEVEAQYKIFREKGLEGQVYIERKVDHLGNELKEITHVVIANENSEAGKFFNAFSIHYLKSRILAQTQAKQFDIADELIKMLKEQIPEIVDIKSDTFTPESVRNEGGFIKTDLKATSLKSISFDLLGDLKVFKGGLDPKYSIRHNRQYLLLEVEMCGAFSATESDMNKYKDRIIHCENTGFTVFEYHGFRTSGVTKNQCIMIRGEKKDIENNQPLSNNREKGDFRLQIQIDPTKCVLRDDPPEFKAISGVLQFKYKLQETDDDIEMY